MLSVVFAVVILTAAASEFSDTGYIEYYPGNCDLIITCPHGGYEEPDSIPDRQAGCLDSDGACYYGSTCSDEDRDTSACKASTFRDSYTKEMCEMLREHIVSITGGLEPHMVVNHLARTKMDANRDIELGAQHNELAESAYLEYEEYIEGAIAAMAGDGDGGMMLDMHGQTHSEQWTELGYYVTKSRLDQDDINKKYTSMYGFLDEECGSDQDCVESYIRGEKSLGKMLQDQGYDTIPSPVNQSPNGGNYFIGGYTLKTFTTKLGSPNAEYGIDGIQIEVPSDIRFSSSAREAFCEDIAYLLVDFIDTNYGL